MASFTESSTTTATDPYRTQRVGRSTADNSRPDADTWTYPPWSYFIHRWQSQPSNAYLRRRSQRQQPREATPGDTQVDPHLDRRQPTDGGDTRSPAIPVSRCLHRCRRHVEPGPGSRCTGDQQSRPTRPTNVPGPLRCLIDGTLYTLPGFGLVNSFGSGIQLFKRRFRYHRRRRVARLSRPWS